MDFLMTINGEQIGQTLEKISVLNPANGKIVGTVPNGGKKEVKMAINSAQEAFDHWSSITAYERADY